jgi:ribosomal protein S18 acetylase RimI-like enzyme
MRHGGLRGLKWICDTFLIKKDQIILMNQQNNKTDLYEILNTQMTDLPQIFALFEHSIQYQEKNGYPVWRNYDRNAIIKDIENKNQYKIVIDEKTAIVFSVCYTDKVIWREFEKGDSVYLHRIVVNPDFKGQRLFGKILDWAVEHCKQKELQNIRMDTWAANPTIADYYKSFGFRFVEDYTTPDSLELPVHNRNLALTLLEYKI